MKSQKNANIKIRNNYEMINDTRPHNSKENNLIKNKKILSNKQKNNINNNLKIIKIGNILRNKNNKFVPNPEINPCLNTFKNSIEYNSINPFNLYLKKSSIK